MSTINEVYKISNFNSEQGKRFNKYKTSEPPLETYNILEGFIEASTPRNNLNASVEKYNSDKKYYPSYVDNNIFVNKNDDDLTERRNCMPTSIRKAVPNSYISGPWVSNGPIPVMNKVPMGKEVVYMIQNDGYTKMVQWPSNTPKYYSGSISLFKASNWDKYNQAPRGTYILTIDKSSLENTKQYNSHQEAVAACKSIALSNSPQHNVYTIDAYGSNNNYTYTCTTHQDDKGGIYSTIKPGDYNKNNRTLYTFKPNYKPPPRFVLSPTVQTYAEHKEICNKSNGKWTMASITSKEDHIKINTVRGNNEVIIGGHRIAKRSPIWKWEDGSRWDDDISGTLTKPGRIQGCGWYRNGSPRDNEPNNWPAPNGDEPVLMIWNRGPRFGHGPWGTWNDAGENTRAYAVYKEVATYSVVLSRDGTLRFDSLYGNIKIDRISAVNGTDNKISLPQSIPGCDQATGGDLNKQSINLKYKYNCPT